MITENGRLPDAALELVGDRLDALRAAIESGDSSRIADEMHFLDNPPAVGVVEATVAPRREGEVPARAGRQVRGPARRPRRAARQAAGADPVARARRRRRRDADDRQRRERRREVLARAGALHRGRARAAPSPACRASRDARSTSTRRWGRGCSSTSGSGRPAPRTRSSPTSTRWASTSPRRTTSRGFAARSSGIGANLVVIDSLRRLTPSKSENDSDDMAPAVVRAGEARAGHGARDRARAPQGRRGEVLPRSTAIRDQCRRAVRAPARPRRRGRPAAAPVPRRQGQDALRARAAGRVPEHQPGGGRRRRLRAAGGPGPVVPVREAVAASIKAALPVKYKKEAAEQGGPRHDGQDVS